jgi:alkanesulfonate monooxygenase SsuD/methylene tetrahydromethanopterin reductase-like flavin-dependent oxidoreductase (luciferase family)
MDIGVVVGGNGPDAIAAAVRDVADAGVRRAWLPQVFSGEALTIIAVLGRDFPDMEFGTAVIPTYPRHPLVLAEHALTTSAALGGARLHLGIGLSHQLVIEGMLGMAFEKPAKHMREYLSALRPALDGQPVSVQGETLRANTLMGPIRIDGAGPNPVLVAAISAAELRVGR